MLPATLSRLSRGPPLTCPLRSLHRHRRNGLYRFASTSAESKDAASQLTGLAIVPRFLRRYVEPLRRAPVTHISSFLLLHELTAIVPLFGLAAMFHYSHWMPPFISEGKWVSDGVEKFGRWFKKRGWLGEDGNARAKWWGRGEGGIRLVTELATAYAITKAILPLRLAFSVYATPWFARLFVIPLLGMLKRLVRKKPKASGAVGTGAIAAGAVGRAGAKEVGVTGSSPVETVGKGSL